MATGRRTIGAHTRSGDHTHTLELIPRRRAERDTKQSWTQDT
jgi:hypothetical protein